MSFLWKALGFPVSIPKFPFTPCNDNNDTRASASPEERGAVAACTVTAMTSQGVKWLVQQGSANEDGKPVTIFSCALDRVKDERVHRAARKALQHARTLMLPGLLRFYGGTEHAGRIYIATEPCEPLDHVLLHPGKRAYYYGAKWATYENGVALGLKDVCGAIAALHKNNLIHGNVCSSNIYVTPGGMWRLSGLELVCRVVGTDQGASAGYSCASYSLSGQKSSLGACANSASSPYASLSAPLVLSSHSSTSFNNNNTNNITNSNGNMSHGGSSNGSNDFSLAPTGAVSSPLSAPEDGLLWYTQMSTSFLVGYHVPPELQKAANNHDTPIESQFATLVDAWGTACLLYESLGMVTEMKNSNAHSPSDHRLGGDGGGYCSSHGEGASSETVLQRIAQTSMTEMRGCRHMPRALQANFTGLTALSPRVRHSVIRFMDSAEFITGSCYVRTITALEQLAMMHISQREKFFDDLARLVADFPLRCCLYNVLPKLVESLQIGVLANVLAPILSIAERVSEEADFAQHVSPVLVQLYATPDQLLHYRLLEKASAYSGQVSAEVLNKQIWPHFVKGFSSTVPSIREHSARALVHLAPKLNPSLLAYTAVPALTKLHQDADGRIRSNATVSLCLIAPYLPADVRGGLLLSGFVRMLRDPFPASRLVALRSLQTTMEYYTIRQLCESVIPNTSLLGADGQDDIRALALSIMHAALGILNAQHKEAMALSSAAAAAGGTNAMTSATTDATLAYGSAESVASGSNAMMTMMRMSLSSLGAVEDVNSSGYDAYDQAMLPVSNMRDDAAMDVEDSELDASQGINGAGKRFGNARVRVGGSETPWNLRCVQTPTLPTPVYSTSSPFSHFASNTTAPATGVTTRNTNTTTTTTANSNNSNNNKALPVTLSTWTTVSSRPVRSATTMPNSVHTLPAKSNSKHDLLPPTPHPHHSSSPTITTMSHAPFPAHSLTKTSATVSEKKRSGVHEAVSHTCHSHITHHDSTIVPALSCAATGIMHADPTVVHAAEMDEGWDDDEDENCASDTDFACPTHPSKHHRNMNGNDHGDAAGADHRVGGSIVRTDDVGASNAAEKSTAVHVTSYMDKAADRFATSPALGLASQQSKPGLTDAAASVASSSSRVTQSIAASMSICSTAPAKKLMPAVTLPASPADSNSRSLDVLYDTSSSTKDATPLPEANLVAEMGIRSVARANAPPKARKKTAGLGAARLS